MSPNRPAADRTAVTDDPVAYVVVDRVAEIVLQRPPANALTVGMVEAVIGALGRAAADEAADVVIIASAVPRRFCAGLDLGALAGASPADTRRLLDTLYVRLFAAQQALGKPSIAAIDGAARGGGMTLAIGCDLLVAGRAASFGYPEIDIGVLPAIHFEHLPRLVGRHLAFDLLFTARTFGADAALQAGLVSRVVDEGQALAEARSLARVLAAKPQAALRAGRRGFRAAVDAGWQAHSARAVDAFCAVAHGPEAVAGIARFTRGKA